MVTTGRVVGVDITPGMIEIASRKKQQSGINGIDFEVDDITRLDFPENTFDRITVGYGVRNVPDIAHLIVGNRSECSNRAEDSSPWTLRSLSILSTVVRILVTSRLWDPHWAGSCTGILTSIDISRNPEALSCAARRPATHGQSRIRGHGLSDFWRRNHSNQLWSEVDWFLSSRFHQYGIKKSRERSDLETFS